MLTTLTSPKITVIRPQGHLKDTKASEFERDMISALTQETDTTLLVNLELVESIDSYGLMSLVSALKLANKLERNFQICSVSPSVKIILELTQLDGVLKICEPEI